jgi:ABC-type transport system involved in multi-copper enzyme maturation permease subunit
MLQPLATIARFTAAEAIHTRFGWLLAAVVLLGFSLVQFLAQAAITETREIQVALLAASFRFTLVFLFGLFVITGITREHDDKVVDLMLSLPLPRGVYYLGKLVGYSLLCLVSVLSLALLLALFTTPDAAVLWGASLFLELLIVCAASLLFGFAFGQVTPAVSALAGFYLISRAIASIQLMAHGPLAKADSFSQAVMTRLVDGIAYLLPDLAQFTRTEWVVYPAPHWPDLLMLAGQTLVYVLLLAAITLFDLYRRDL